MSRKTSFICSLCFRSLAVGRWFEGQWVCMCCQLHMRDQQRPEAYEPPPLRRIAEVRIEEIGTEL